MNKLDEIIKRTKKEMDLPLEQPGSGDAKDAIMVVDDDENLVKSLDFVFKENYVVFGCVNGTEAVRTYKKNQDVIRAVLLDIKMNDMDGTQVCVEIQKINPVVPIIFNTAYPGEYKPLDLLQTLHPFGYVVKGSQPFDIA